VIRTLSKVMLSAIGPLMTGPVVSFVVVKVRCGPVARLPAASRPRTR
jgi:hypothetical protein